MRWRAGRLACGAAAAKIATMPLTALAYPNADRFLRFQPWFESLPQGTQQALLRATRVLRVPKGGTALQAGESSRGWYAVLSGFVKLQTPGMDESVAAYLAISGGEWFGEGSAMKDEPRRYEVVALRDTELLCVPKEIYRDLLETSLPFNRAVMAHLNRRLAQAMAIIEAQRTGSPEQRIALYLTRLFWHGLRRLDMSQEELGSLAGMCRQSANRVLQQLEQRGLVTLHQGRVTALRQEALDDFVANGGAMREQLACAA